MTERILGQGDVITVVFPEQTPQGREQEGYRPAIVVGIPERLGVPRFKLLIVVPMTTDKGMPWVTQSPELYPRFPQGTANLVSASVALLDQIRAIDPPRVVKFRGKLTPEQYLSVRDGLFRLFSFEKTV